MKKLIIVGIFLLLGVTSCTVANLGTEDAEVQLPTPTTFRFFDARDESDSDNLPATNSPMGVPTVASLFTERNTPTPRPTLTPVPTISNTGANNTPLDLEAEDLIAYTIFDDSLNVDWEIIETTGRDVDLSSSDHVLEGDYAIAFTPEDDFSSIYFAVKPDSSTIFPYDKVLGLSFQISGGDESIHRDELALAVIGSNDFTYWVADDTSVDLPPGEFFSETALYFLGINNSILPNTWTEIFVQLDSLIYDPEYDYVVGFYLKNDAGFRNSVYIDNVNLILIDELPSSPASNVQTPSPTVLATPTLAATADATETADDEATATATATGAAEDDGTAVPTPESTPEPTVTEEACVITPPSGWVQYTIQAGDSLSNLAVDRGESVEFVLQVNCLGPGTVLSIGQTIWLPDVSP
ncbi:MAG: LysM peptidoglycan-binding domain-containing protein [Chloroflexota bacterium]